MERVVAHGGMLSVRTIRIKENNLWVIRRGGKHTNRVSRGNRNGSWKWIRGISVYFGGQGISSMLMGGRFIYVLTPSTGKVLLNES